MTRIVLVTGTDTGVGKTIATAALAAAEIAGGRRVLTVKPAQTGAAGDEPDDAATVRRLTGCDVATLTTLAEPLAPETAARRAGVAIPTVTEHAEAVRGLAAAYDVVLVEGAGGLLVRLDRSDGTLPDLALALGAAVPGSSTSVVVVARAGLGTLNHTALTVDALRQREIEPAGVLIGSWPAAPGLAETCNLDDLPRVTGVPVVGVIPEGAGSLARAAFVAGAPGWLQIRPGKC